MKPGRVAAFASVAGSVEIALEVFSSTESSYTRQTCRRLAERIPKFTHMDVSNVVAMPQGTLPITPISTVQRRHAKACLLKGKLPILFDFPERKNRISLGKTADILPVMDSFSQQDDDDDQADESEAHAGPPSKDQSQTDADDTTRTDGRPGKNLSA